MQACYLTHFSEYDRFLGKSKSNVYLRSCYLDLLYYFQNGNISLIIYICKMSLYHFLTNTLIWISIFYLSVKGFTTHRQISFRKYLNVSCKLYPPRQTTRIDYRHIWPIRLELVIILMFILSCKFYYLVVHMDTSRLYRARKMLKFVGLFLHFIFHWLFILHELLNILPGN